MPVKHFDPPEERPQTHISSNRSRSDAPPGGTVEKDKALSTAIQQIERSYGKGAIMKLGEVSAARDVTVIPTGALPLDLALGVGGMPRGRVVEIYGPESAGENTPALPAIAGAQRAGRGGGIRRRRARARPALRLSHRGQHR